MSNFKLLFIEAVSVVILTVAIAWVFFRPKPTVVGSKNPVRTIANLEQDYSSPLKYNQITVNDIVDGTILRSEMAVAQPFGSDTWILKYTRNDIGLYNSQLLISDGDLTKIKTDFANAPFRNLYFYKIKNGDNWLTILGQQVKNGDGSSAFLHYVIGNGKDIYVWGTNVFGVQPLLVVPYQYFDMLQVPRDFFSSENNYYQKGGRVETLMSEWQKNGIVPLELEKTVLLMTIKI